MHISAPHVSRTSLQMLSGAAGLIAAFTSISLLFSLPGAAGGDALPGLVSWGRATVVGLTIGCAALAYTLLRFSVSPENHEALHHHAHSISTRKLR